MTQTAHKQIDAAASTTDFCDFIREELGTRNWVMARRSPNIVQRYGSNVVCISKAHYKKLEQAWQAQYGNREVTADEYREYRGLKDINAALLDALQSLLSDTQNGELATVGQVMKARAAIAKAA